MEKLGFGAILFFIIWTYMKSILPKTHEELEKLRAENRKLLDEITKLNQLRERDQKLIALHLREIKEMTEAHLSNSGIRKAPLIPDTDNFHEA